MRAAMSAPMASRPRSVKINIGWTENDYEIDIANASGRDEYKRIIRRSAQLGIDHVLFAPRNTDVSSRDRATDAWRWEEILWFGLGEAVRALQRGAGLEPDGIVGPASLEVMNASRFSWIDRIDELLALPGFETKKQTNGAKEAVRLMTPNIQGMTSAREIRS